MKDINSNNKVHYKMDWVKLLCSQKLYPSSIRVNDDNDRSEFERDHNKILFAPHFRQLQNKTQLFPQPVNAFIHTRLTHTLEVASIGKSIGNLIAKRILGDGLFCADSYRNEIYLRDFARDMSDVVGAACLLHDIGNPPFGHSGEDAISSFFNEVENIVAPILGENLFRQLSNFDGNAQTIRVISTSHNLNLTLATIGSVIKYPHSCPQKSSIYKSKFSIFDTELEVLEKVANTCGLVKLANGEYARHPLVFLVEAADDICYRLIDLEDAHKIGLISFNDAYNLLMGIICSRSEHLDYIQQNIESLTVSDKFAKLRSYAINILIGEVVTTFMHNYTAIMDADYSGMLTSHGKLKGLVDLIIEQDSAISKSLQDIAKSTKNTAYCYKPVVEIELAGYEVLGFLLNKFIFAIFDKKAHINPLYAKKILQLLPEDFHRASNTTQKVMCVVDYIASMTDRYAIDLYQKLNGIDFPKIGD